MTLQSKYFSKTVAAKSLAMCLHGIEAILASGSVKRSGLAIVIGCRYSDTHGHYASRVFVRHSINRSAWGDRSYEDLALGKFETTCQTGLTGNQLVNDKPWLVEAHHVKWGGAVIEDNIVVATSGCTENEDRMFAEIILAAIKCIVREKARKRLEGPGDTFAGSDE